MWQFLFVCSICKILISSQIHTCRETWLYLQRTMNIFILLNLLSVSIRWFCFKYPLFWYTTKHNSHRFMMIKMMSAILKTFRNVLHERVTKYFPSIIKPRIIRTKSVKTYKKRPAHDEKERKSAFCSNASQYYDVTKAC